MSSNTPANQGLHGRWYIAPLRTNPPNMPNGQPQDWPPSWLPLGTDHMTARLTWHHAFGYRLTFERYAPLLGHMWNENVKAMLGYESAEHDDRVVFHQAAADSAELAPGDIKTSYILETPLHGPVPFTLWTRRPMW